MLVCNHLFVCRRIQINTGPTAGFKVSGDLHFFAQLQRAARLMQCCIGCVIHASAHNVVALTNTHFSHVITTSLFTRLHQDSYAITWCCIACYIEFGIARIAYDVHVGEACIRTCRWTLPWPMGHCVADSLSGSYSIHFQQTFT